MNYIKHLNTVFDDFYSDNRLSANHISLYMALFHSWNEYRFENPFPVMRAEVMKASKIGSLSTYTKCMWQLHEWFYIQYVPSHNPATGTLIYLYRFDTTERTTQRTTDNKTDVQLVEQLHYNINHTNKIENLVKNETENPPPKNDVVDFFKKENQLEIEAEKFYNYFESNGWLVGGKTKMKDWKAAARNWMLNAQKFENQKNSKSPSGNLNTEKNKNYGEPL